MKFINLKLEREREREESKKQKRESTQKKERVPSDKTIQVHNAEPSHNL